MLTRRHIRVKVLQSLYSLQHTQDPDLDKQEKFLVFSMEQMRDLYILMLQLFVAIRHSAIVYKEIVSKKHLVADHERNPSLNFIDNRILKLIVENKNLAEAVRQRKLNYWQEDDEYGKLIFKELREQDWYDEYLQKDKPSFGDDKEILLRIYKEVIAPHDKLYDYLEDKRLTWLDDFPLVNTAIVKSLSRLNSGKTFTNLVPDLYKNNEDRDFAVSLFRKTILNDEKLSAEIDGKTPNWDKDRIAEVDMILLKMGIAEFLYFPSIPVRATINEYLEISKEYSTPKSSLFINGILDKMVKDFTEADKLNKIGRGLR